MTADEANKRFPQGLYCLCRVPLTAETGPNPTRVSRIQEILDEVRQPRELSVIVFGRFIVYPDRVGLIGEIKTQYGVFNAPPEWLSLLEEKENA